MENIVVYTDGSCIGNPGAGGWAAIIQQDDAVKILCGGAGHATNNRMELTAVIRALQHLDTEEPIVIRSDSNYVCNAVNLHWLDSWHRNGWVGKTGEIANVELWQELYKLMAARNCQFQWIKGHAGDPMNEECDGLAREQAEYYLEHPEEEGEVKMVETKKQTEEPNYKVLYMDALSVLDHELCADSRRYMGVERACGEFIYCDFCKAQNVPYACGLAFIQQQTGGRRV